MFIALPPGNITDILVSIIQGDYPVDDGMDTGSSPIGSCACTRLWASGLTQAIAAESRRRGDGVGGSCAVHGRRGVGRYVVGYPSQLLRRSFGVHLFGRE